MSNESFSPIVGRLIREWNTADINYCHWKGVGNLSMSFQALTDLDILISTESYKKAEAIALSLGFVALKTAECRAYPSVLDFIAYDKKIDRFVHLHLHYQLMMGDKWVVAYRLPLEYFYLKNKKWNELYKTWMVSPEDEFITFFARRSVKQKNIFLRKDGQENIYEINEILERIEQKNDLLMALENYPKIMREPILSIFKEKASEHHNEMASNVRRVMQDFMRMPYVLFVALSVIRYSYRAFVEIFRRYTKTKWFGRRRMLRGGLSVAFVGMDGCGKTSAISRNLAFFSKQLDVADVFLGTGKSGAPFYRRLIFRLLGAKAKNKKHINARSKDQKKPFYYQVWFWICAIERIKAIKRVHQMRTNGVLVLVDRWPQDTISDGFDAPRLHGHKSVDGFLGKIAQSAENKVLNLSKIMAPDVIFRMVVSPEKSLERKPGELTYDQAVLAATNLEKIQWPENCKIYDIDCNQPVEFVDREIREKIWDLMK